jgi:hypothetical protein
VLVEMCSMNNEPFEVLARALAEFRREIAATDGDAMDLLAVEQRVQELTNAYGRALMREAMSRADISQPEITIAGARWGNRRVTRATYATVFGDVDMDRSTYQQGGRGRVAVPLELQLGIVEGAYTPRVARILTKAVALMPDAEAADLLAEVGVAKVSKSTLHRVPRAMAARYEARRDVIDKSVRESDAIPQDTATLQISLDGVMVPQDGEHARPRGRRSDDPEPPRHEQRYGPGQPGTPASEDHHVGRSWHEASVGTVGFFDESGRRLKTTYLARMPEASKATLVSQLEQELQSVLAERPELNVCFASDGAPQHWRWLEGMAARLPAAASGRRMMLVDAFHVFEYVQLAANAIEGELTPEAKVLAATWRETIREQDDGVTTVLRSMRARRRKAPSKTAKKELEKAIDYIAHQQELGRTAYTEARAQNMPIGTGITEAAAKTIVAVRMKRAGARFTQHGGQTVMLFRAAALSGRFDALHRELHATYQARIAA